MAIHLLRLLSSPPAPACSVRDPLLLPPSHLRRALEFDVCYRPRRPCAQAARPKSRGASPASPCRAASNLPPPPVDAPRPCLARAQPSTLLSQIWASRRDSLLAALPGGVRHGGRQAGLRLCRPPVPHPRCPHRRQQGRIRALLPPAQGLSHRRARVTLL
jgi:hypothetical protein